MIGRVLPWRRLGDQCIQGVELSAWRWGLVPYLGLTFFARTPEGGCGRSCGTGATGLCRVDSPAYKRNGSVIQISAPRLFECAKRLEEFGRQGGLAEASSICTDVETCLAEMHAGFLKLSAGGFLS
jgi:hypothetical protein